MATTPGPDDALAPDQPESAPPRLVARVEPHTDGPDSYTITPHDATGSDQMSRWLTAPADIVCDLTEMR